MNQKTILADDKLRLTAAYLNINEEGRTLLDTVTKKLAETEQEEREKQREKKEESE